MKIDGYDLNTVFNIRFLKKMDDKIKQSKTFYETFRLFLIDGLFLNDLELLFQDQPHYKETHHIILMFCLNSDIQTIFETKNTRSLY